MRLSSTNQLRGTARAQNRHNGFRKKVYAATKRIPKGSVATYTIVATATGNPKAVRAVGNALNKNPSRSVPCHRVIRKDRTAGGFVRGREEKVRLLKNEGVKFINGKIDASCILWAL